MKQVKWIGLVFAVLVLGAIAFSSFRSQPFHCKVCMSFDGHRDCRTASAQTAQEAQRTATTAACAQLASGVTDSGRCENTPPLSVEWLQ
jgi:hypothetical protein